MFTNPITLRSYQIEQNSHAHDYAQMVLPLAGALELEVEGQGAVVNDSTGAYIAANHRHAFSGSQENLFLVVDFEPNTIFNKQVLPSTIPLTPSAKEFLQFTRNYLTQKQRNYSTEFLISQLLLDLILQPLISANDLCVMRAIQWIDSHFSLPITVASVTQHCHLSVSQLQRRFKHATGQGIAEYWRMKKMQKAQQLLLTSSLSIEAIALEVGYQNLSAFSRQFTQLFGQSPSQWRNRTLSA